MKTTLKASILHRAAIVLVLSALSVSGATRYLNAKSASPTPPFINRATAALAIQGAVEAALIGDQILVTNSVAFNGGGCCANCILFTKTQWDLVGTIETTCSRTTHAIR